jgi:hypothetical protein
MVRRLREAVVIAAVTVAVAGPIAAAALPLAPASWRSPAMLWGILLSSLGVVAAVRARRRNRR